MAIARPQDVADRSWVRLLTVQNIACTVLFGVAALLILYPIALLILNGFTLKNGAGQTRFGYDLWMQTWRQPGLPAAVLNSFKVVGASTTISLPVALVLAWLATRTDMPGKSLLSACCWIAFFMPVLPVVLGWILLFDPHAGIVNRYLKAQFGVIEPIFNIYSFWGIVFCHLVTKSIAAKYIFLVPAFRNISATIEESSHIADPV
ncbi:hypothetical protein PY365_24335 [Roseiarcaceae bacterium H3SJ34-1]|uniref:hypothetical protein n=1 Tax=Terripilifer ovatus TaxID=3032367 RepID=UPI003AB93487|nr:hypothetical protein [Roseiarcaceae bacterium H3SJ34-1]